MICERCGKEFFEDWRRDKEWRKSTCRFCSRSCSNSRLQTEERKKRIAAKLRKSPIQYCSKCKKQLGSGNKSGLCKGCCPPSKSRGKMQNDYRKKRKEELVNYKGGKCIKCGYCKSMKALQFHHRDPKEKSFNLSSKKSGKITTLEIEKKEVDKCDLLCSNCHAEIHDELLWG